MSDIDWYHQYTELLLSTNNMAELHLVIDKIYMDGYADGVVSER